MDRAGRDGGALCKAPRQQRLKRRMLRALRRRRGRQHIGGVLGKAVGFAVFNHDQGGVVEADAALGLCALGDQGRACRRFGRGELEAVVQFIVAPVVEHAQHAAVAADHAPGARRFAGFGEGVKDRRVGRAARVFVAVVEVHGGRLDGDIDARTHPSAALGVGQQMNERAVDREAAQLLPGPVAGAVHLQRKGDRLRVGVAESQHAVVVAVEEERLAHLAGGEGVAQPDRAAADGRAEAVEARGIDEPEVGVGLHRGAARRFKGTVVQELFLRRVVAAEDHAVVPAREVADHFEVIGTRGDAGGTLEREGGRKAPEGAVHGGQQILLADLADARPLGVPAVRAVIGVAAFRQAVGVPLPVLQQHQDQRAVVPAQGPDRIGVRIGVAGDAAGAGDLGELVLADERPVALALPDTQRAGGDVGPHRGVFTARAVVGIDQKALAGVEAFAVVPRQFGVDALAGARLAVAVLDVLLKGEGADIDAVKALLHRGDVDLVGRIGHVARGAGQASGHRLGRQHTHVAVFVDEVGPDVELPALQMDHAVGRGAAHAFRADDLLQFGRDLVQLVAGAQRQMRAVGDDPQPAGPRDDRPRTAFALVVVHREMRIDAGNLPRCGCGRSRNAADGEQGKSHDPVFHCLLLPVGRWLRVGASPISGCARTPPPSDIVLTPVF